MEAENNGAVSLYSPCYPSYAIRDVYMHSGFDYVILVEDILAKYFVDKIIQEKKLNYGKLINVLPVGGWENVLKFQNMAYNTNTFGIGANMFSILDGDVENEPKIRKQYNSLPKLFLPINSIEKYLLNVCTNSNYKNIKRIINDTFFNVESIDNILSDYVKDGDTDGKPLYRRLLANLEKRGISEDTFVKGLCEIIMSNLNTEYFADQLTEKLQ